MIYIARPYLKGTKRPEMYSNLIINLPSGTKADARREFLSYLGGYSGITPEKLASISIDVYDQDTYLKRFGSKTENSRTKLLSFERRWPVGVVYNSFTDTSKIKPE